MTSAISEEDIRSAAYLAGIKDPARLNSFMRTVNLYAYALARKMSALEDVPPGKLHLCRGCGSMKTADEFPESKRANIAKGVNCIKCQDKRTYKCIGPCGQYKPLREFPVRKQENPHVPSWCSYCTPTTMSRKEVP